MKEDVIFAENITNYALNCFLWYLKYHIKRSDQKPRKVCKHSIERIQPCRAMGHRPLAKKVRVQNRVCC